MTGVFHTEELKVKADKTENWLGIFLLMNGFSADKRTVNNHTDGVSPKLHEYGR